MIPEAHQETVDPVSKRVTWYMDDIKAPGYELYGNQEDDNDEELAPVHMFAREEIA